MAEQGLHYISVVVKGAFRTLVRALAVLCRRRCHSDVRPYHVRQACDIEEALPEFVACSQQPSSVDCVRTRP